MSQPSLFEPEKSTDDAGLSPIELADRLGLAYPPTPEQAAAVAAPLHPHLIVAGAGSGKTETMGLRVVWLVSNGLVQPHQVLGLTFTRRAAAELGERVRRMLRRLRQAHDRAPFLTDQVLVGLRAGEPIVTTYHSYAATLVGEHALRIGVEPATRLVGEAVAWQIAASVVESYDGSMEAVDRAPSTVIGDVLELASDLAEHLSGPGEVVDLAAAVRGQLESLPRAPDQRTKGLHHSEVVGLLRSLDARNALLPLVSSYSAAKQARSVMDYGDQVAVAARIAHSHQQVGEIERGRFAAVLLDEYQDTGEAQRVLLTSLFGGGHPVTAVGDPRQSIYGWRGASAGNLERFGADFALTTRDVAASGESGLTVSFRNGERILGVANLVADRIPVRVGAGSQLTPGRGHEGVGRVVVALHDTWLDEAAWLADQVAQLGSDGLDWGSIAVLVRKRSHFPRLEAALRGRAVPCEVVGLGGLLHEPEVLDVVATLRVLADPSAGGSLLRLLAGPRWRLGPRDLDALGRRARRLAVGGPTSATEESASVDSPAATEVDPDYDAVDERSLVDALDDPGDARSYTADGHRRLLLLRDELRRLRRLTSSSLPDLVVAVMRSMELDIELASRPGVRSVDAHLDVDRLVEVAEDFVDAGESPSLLAFLAYLDAADEREHGLEVELAEPEGSRVALMTVHAAKGLEWDAVFVAGMTKEVFPVEGRPVADWTKGLATLPFPLRGDRSELPELTWAAATDQAEARDAVKDFQVACRTRGALEERRLAYVAVTRARSLLACSGYWWDSATKARGPSSLLEEIHGWCTDGGGEVECWASPPEADDTNPLDDEVPSAVWPFDPLGERRAAVEAGAAMVRRSLERHASPESDADAEAEAEGELTDADLDRVAGWDTELDLLLAELARDRGRASTTLVDVPDRLSVSQLVLLRRDPAQLARALRRPLPRRPAPQARRGTRFHLWLEARWGQQRLIEDDQLPGAADETAAPDDDLLTLQEAFLASAWANRVPAEIELPFDLMVAGLVLRGRCDAVFTDAADGLVDVVDWKTGPPLSGADAEAAAVQLAAYRLAWHHLTGTQLEAIRASFHHVGVNETVRPADLLDEAGLVALIGSVPASPTPSAD